MNCGTSTGSGGYSGWFDGLAVGGTLLPCTKEGIIMSN